MQSFVKLFKNLLFLFPVSLVFSPFNRLFMFLAFYNRLQIWIWKNKKQFLYSDYFSLKRDYEKRYSLYKFVNDHFNLKDKKFVYLEFGVANGSSFKWWLESNANAQSSFHGFDTFEGLPEKWGGYAKGDMKANIPELNDPRAHFYKGLFQETLQLYLSSSPNLKQENKIIHLDADLYSSTIFVLSQLYPFLKKGDLILFDEFNVPMHEFKGYQEFIQSFYVQLKPIAAVNNFYQVCFEVE